jgi:hypothetical protein
MPSSPPINVRRRAGTQGAQGAKSLPAHVTLDACRHGGMTELGDAELAEQGVMARSGHRTPQAARLYVKRTEHQRAAAKRRAWVEQNDTGAKVEMEDHSKSGNEVEGTRKSLETLERAKGIEPSTLSLGS